MALQKTGVQMVAEGAVSFNRALADGDKAVLGFGKTAGTASGQVTSFSQIAVGALRQVGAIAVNALAQAGRAVVGFVGDSVKKAGDFQAGLNEFAAVTGGALKDSGKSLKDFSDLFIQLGRDLPVSTKDVEDAAIELAKGGIDPATIAAGGLRTSLNLAAAGGLGLADSATIMAKQLGVWVDASASATEKSAFLTQTADLLSQAANVTTSDVADMALGLANAGGQAKLTGLSFRETVQTMALIAPSFSSAGDAGTSFKTFLSSLQPTTKPAIAAMKGLGLYTDATGSAFYDAQGKFVGMEKVSALLQSATAGLSEEQKSLALRTIFGSDAIRVAAFLAEKGAAGYDAMGQQLDAAGTVADQAAARQQGYNTALENAKGSFEALQLTVGSYLIPILTNLLNTVIAPGINSVTTFASAFFDASDKVGFLTTAIDGVLPGFATLVSWLQVQIPLAVTTLSGIWTGTLQPALVTFGAFLTGTVIPGLISLNTWITTNVGSWGQIALAVTAGVIAFQALSTIAGIVAGVATAFGAFGTAVTAAGSVLGGIVAILGGPVTVAIGAVALAVAGLTLAWQTNFLGIRDSLTGWWEGSGRAIFTEVKTWLADTLAKAVQGLAELWTGTLQPALTSVWSFIQGSVIPTLTTLATGALNGVQTAASAVASFWTGTLQPALSAVWSFVQGSVIPVLTTLATGALAGVKTGAQLLSDLWNNILLPALTGVWSFVDTKLVPLFVALADVYIAALKLGTTALAGLWQNVLQPALAAVWSYLDKNVVPVLNVLGTVAMVAVKIVSKEIADFWNSTLQPALNSVGSVLKDQVNPAVTSLSGFLSVLKGAFGDITSAIQSTTTWLGTLAKGLSNLKLPDWLTPGSPTPWEIGLWGISRALQQVGGRDLPGLDSSLRQVNQSLGATAQYTATTGEGAGVRFVAGMSLGILKSMPSLLAAMRASLDATIQEIVGWVDTDATGTLNAAGAAALNAFMTGLSGSGTHIGPANTGGSFIGPLKQSLGQITAGMTDTILLGMPDVLAAMRKSTNTLIQEIVGVINSGDTTSILTQAGADAINALIAGMNKATPALTGFQKITDKLGVGAGIGSGTGVWQPVVDDTKRAWDQIHGTVDEQIGATKASATAGANQLGADASNAWVKLGADTQAQFGLVHTTIATQLGAARGAVNQETGVIRTTTDHDFQLVSAATKMHFDQVHADIGTQITAARTQLGQTTGVMQTSTAKTFGQIQADAKQQWDTTKTNITTPVGAAKDSVSTDSSAMQRSMIIPLSLQSQIEQTYQTVTETMARQIHKVTEAINDLYNRWRALLDLPKPSAPKGGGTNIGGGSPGASPPGVKGPAPKASGGPVFAGMSYLVGERGRELFTPSVNGSILPASLTQRISPPASARQIVSSAVSHNTTYGPTFQIQAQYKYQAERSLVQDIRTLQMLYPST